MRLCLVFPLLLGCGLVLDLDPPADGSADALAPDIGPDVGPDAMVDAGPDVPPIVECDESGECPSDPFCITNCVEGSCVPQDENEDGLCDCEDGAIDTLESPDSCASLVRTCIDSTPDVTRFPRAPQCGDEGCGGVADFEDATCGVGACSRATSCAVASCFGGSMAVLDGCGGGDEDCDGQEDEDCDDLPDCDIIISRDDPRIDLEEVSGNICLIADTDKSGACRPTNFNILGDTISSDTHLIGDLRYAADGTSGGGLQRCRRARNSAPFARVSTENTVRVIGTTLQLTGVHVQSLRTPVRLNGSVLEARSSSLKGDEDVALRGSESTVEIFASRVDGGIALSDSSLRVDAGCDALGPRCIARPRPELGVLSLANTPAITMQRGSLVMNATLVIGNRASALDLTDVEEFQLNGSTLATQGLVNGAAVNVDGCERRSHIRESSVSNGGGPGSEDAESLTGVYVGGCPLSVIGSTADVAQPSGQIFGVRGASASNAIGLDCDNERGDPCIVRDVSIRGIAEDSLLTEESEAIAMRCRGVCSIQTSLLVGQAGRNGAGSTIGLLVQGSSRAEVSQATLVGGRGVDTVGVLALGESVVRMQDTLAMGFGINAAGTNPGTSKGAGAIAIGNSRVEVLHSTLGGRARFSTLDLATTCDGAVLLEGSTGVFASSLLTGGACVTRYGVFVDGTSLPIMNFSAMQIEDDYSVGGMSILDPDVDLPFHRGVRFVEGMPLVAPSTGTADFGFGLAPGSPLAGEADDVTATEFDRFSRPRIDPSIGALEPNSP